MQMDQIQSKIMGIMAIIAKGDNHQAIIKIQVLREIIYQELDSSVHDTQIVLLGKYLKILDQLEAKV